MGEIQMKLELRKCWYLLELGDGSREFSMLLASSLCIYLKISILPKGEKVSEKR